MCLCVFRCTYVSTDACGDQRSTEVSSSTASSHYILRQGLSVNLELPNSVRNGGQQVQRVLCLFLTSFKITGRCPAFFMLALGIPTKPSISPACQGPCEVSSPSSLADYPVHCTHRHCLETHLGQFIQKRLQGAGEMAPPLKHLPGKYEDQSLDP